MTTHGLYKHGSDCRKKIGLWEAAKRRAKQFGFSFSISPNDINIPHVCPLLGIPIDLCSTKKSDNSPSLDRIDNAHGYVVGNVWVISWRANRLKSDSTLQELKLITEKLEAKLLEKTINDSR